MIRLVKLDQQFHSCKRRTVFHEEESVPGFPCALSTVQTIAATPGQPPKKPPFYPGKVWYRACFYYSRRSQHPRICSWMIHRFLSSLETLRMKPALFVLCLLSTSAAFAQYLGGASHISSEPQIYEFSSHPAHASYAPMSQEQNVLATSTYSSAQGERPASDFPQPESVSLGLTARELRQQHAQLKKSPTVWVNQ